MGLKFPKGTVFVPFIGATHLDPIYHPNPLEFNPDRFGGDGVVIPGTFLPFGDGPMNCIGQKMAMVEMKAVMINLLARFRVGLAEHQNIKFRHSITYGLKDGVYMDLFKRVQ